MTLLEFLKTKMHMPDEVWDYKVLAPMMDDEAVITIHLWLTKNQLRVVELDIPSGNVTSRNEKRS